MCQASRIVEKKTDAEKGATYGVGQIGVHHQHDKKIGALHALGSTVAACVYCVQTGQKLTFSDIPVALQHKHGLGATAIATFNESDQHDKDDVLDFGNNRRIPFRAFADCGVKVFVGEKKQTDTSAAVANIMAGALQAPVERELVTAK